MVAGTQGTMPRPKKTNPVEVTTIKVPKSVAADLRAVSGLVERDQMDIATEILQPALRQMLLQAMAKRHKQIQADKAD